MNQEDINLIVGVVIGIFASSFLFSLVLIIAMPWIKNNSFCFGFQYDILKLRIENDNEYSMSYEFDILDNLASNEKETLKASELREFAQKTKEDK